MDLFANINWPVAVVVASVAIIALVILFLAIRKVRMRDMYVWGFEDGLHSSLTKIAKLRYHKDMDVCTCVVPVDEYRKELDQYL